MLRLPLATDINDHEETKWKNTLKFHFIYRTIKNYSKTPTFLQTGKTASKYNLYLSFHEELFTENDTFKSCFVNLYVTVVQKNNMVCRSC